MYQRRNQVSNLLIIVAVQPPRPLRQQLSDDEDAELAELRASMAM
jgi:hypothetical protein